MTCRQLDDLSLSKFQPSVHVKEIALKSLKVVAECGFCRGLSSTETDDVIVLSSSTKGKLSFSFVIYEEKSIGKLVSEAYDF